MSTGNFASLLAAESISNCEHVWAEVLLVARCRAVVSAATTARSKNEAVVPDFGSNEEKAPEPVTEAPEGEEPELEAENFCCARSIKKCSFRDASRRSLRVVACL